MTGGRVACRTHKKGGRHLQLNCQLGDLDEIEPVLFRALEREAALALARVGVKV